MTQKSHHRSFGQITGIFADGGVAVLSGAGLSTESGIPDYRGPTGQARRGTPMTYQTFTGGEEARRRYWARSHLGWRHIATAQPNAGHHAVAAFERAGLLAGVITQNVDGLHQAAGTEAVTELHGSLHRVVCLSCGERTPRPALDARLRAANPGWSAAAGEINPDGDVALADSAVASFKIAACAACSGVLKPDVVFFGENVPPPRAAACYDLIQSARSLVVLGSSLTVMSGLRYVRRAASLGLPVAIINQGATRGDELATVTLDAPLGETLTTLAGQLGGIYTAAGATDSGGMGLTQADAETQRLLTAATRYGGVLLPPLTAGDLYALCGESQITMEGDEATWWAGMTAPGRAAMKAVAVDMLLSRELLVPGPDGSFEAAPGVAVTLAARQDPSVMVACSRPDGVTAWAPRLYGIGDAGQRPRAIVLEIVMDKVHGLFGPLHEFGLMSVDAAVRFLTWWVQTPFRARYTRKEPPRRVTVFRGSEGDAEMECHELIITLERHGVVGVTVDRDEGPPETVTCDARSLARLFVRLFGPLPG